MSAFSRFRGALKNIDSSAFDGEAVKENEAGEAVELSLTEERDDDQFLPNLDEQAAVTEQELVVDADVDTTTTTENSLHEHNQLTSSVEIEGDIQFEDKLLVDGKISGSINNVGGFLTVGETAEIHSKDIEQGIKASTVVIFGKVYGNIEAEQVEIRSTGQVIGNISTRSIAIEAGAVFTGECKVTNYE